MRDGGEQFPEFRLLLDKRLVLQGVLEYLFQKLDFEVLEALPTVDHFLDIQDPWQALFFEALHYRRENARVT